MFGFRPLVRHAPPRPWTCLRCVRERPRLAIGKGRQAAYATEAAANAGPTRAPKKKRRTGLIVAATLGIAGYGLGKFTETGQYTLGALERTNRVIYTLAVCINEYRQALNQREHVTQDEYTKILKACHKRCAERCLVAMEKNGSIFIKLGQHMTSLNYMLPNEWCETFIPLQDQCPVTSFEDVKAVIEHDSGTTFDDLFSEFEQEPLGAASLAQVHRAVDRHTGRRVAVKVQHPVLDYWAPLDLNLTALTFSTIKRVFPDYDLTWLSDEMQVSLPAELDFEEEGRNAMQCREYFANFTEAPLIVPEVIWSLRRILVMDYVTGHRPDDLDYLAANRINRDEVSASLARIFNTMIFSPGAPLHCDPHGGNIAIIAHPEKRPPHNFSVILYDHGLYRTIPRDVQRDYAKLWLAVLDADEPNMRRYAYDVAGITDDQFPLFASAITGRDYRVVARGVSTPHSQEEKEAITEAMGDGMLQQLVELLGKVPRIILLILKTNDLTRSLDNVLQTKQGPMRSFLILAQYAAETVYEEQVEKLREGGGLFWPPGHARRLVAAWGRYARIVVKLRVYEWYLYVRAVIGLENPDPGGGMMKG